MTHVFISYAPEDENLVSLLEADLIERGHPIWREREGGYSNDKATAQIALNDAYATLVVLSAKCVQQHGPSAKSS